MRSDTAGPRRAWNRRRADTPAGLCQSKGRERVGGLRPRTALRRRTWVVGAGRRLIELARHHPCPENFQLATPQRRFEVAGEKGVEEVAG